MAETIGLGASIIGIAGAGVTVVTALTKFGISYKESNDKIQELAARVSLTATILQAIGDTVKGNEAGFKKEAFMITWKEVLDACAGIYEKIQAAISKAKGKNVAKKGNSVVRLETWVRLKWALGGDTRVKDLEDSLQKSAEQVTMMLQVIQLTAIKLIDKTGQVPIGAVFDERKELMGKMDWILAGLVKSGLIAFDDFYGTPSLWVKDVPRSESTRSKVNESTSIETMSTHVSGMRLQGRNLLRSSVSLTTPRDFDSVPNRSSTSSSPGVTSESRVFEAYFIIPQSISCNSPDGVFNITQSSHEEFMTVLLNTD